MRPHSSALGRRWIGLVTALALLAPVTTPAALAGKKDKDNGSRPQQQRPSSSGKSRSSSPPPQRQGSGGSGRQREGQASGGSGTGSRQGYNRQGSELQRRGTNRPGEADRRQSYPLGTPYRRPSSKNASRHGGSSRTARSDGPGRQKRTVVNRNVVHVKRRVDRTVVVKGRWGYRRSWVAARPWGWGWYGGWGPGPVVYPAWSWWAVSAPAWGVVSLSPTIVIQQSMDEAVAESADSFAVPNSDFEIFHASIRPIGERVIEFNFAYDQESFLAKADCELGLLNDEEPSGLDEAELMHAACSLAFGSFDPGATRG
jgi:hypothetical protein